MKVILNIIRRLLIIIWTIIMIIISFFGGFLLFPLLHYLMFGEISDPTMSCWDVWFNGKEIIDKIFNYLCDIKINKNSNFWK